MSLRTMTRGCPETVSTARGSGAPLPVVAGCAYPCKLAKKRDAKKRAQMISFEKQPRRGAIFASALPHADVAIFNAAKRSCLDIVSIVSQDGLPCSLRWLWCLTLRAASSFLAQQHERVDANSAAGGDPGGDQSEHQHGQDDAAEDHRILHRCLIDDEGKRARGGKAEGKSC